MLDDLAVFIVAENIDPRDAGRAGHFLKTVEHDEAAFGDDALKMHVFVGVVFGQLCVIIHERFFAVSDRRIMLDINIPDIITHSLSGA